MIKWRVYYKVAPDSSWKFTGVIERDRETAHKVWSSFVERNHWHAYKLEYCTYGVTIER